MDEHFDFCCHPGEVGPGRDWPAKNEGTFRCVCVYVCVSPVLSVSLSRYMSVNDGKQAANLEQSQSS